MILKNNYYSIEQVSKVKALGMFISNCLSNIATINQMISKVKFWLTVMRSIFKYCDIRTKGIVMNSLVISVFRYGCQLLLNSNICLITQRKKDV